MWRWLPLGLLWMLAGCAAAWDPLDAYREQDPPAPLAGRLLDEPPAVVERIALIGASTAALTRVLGAPSLKRVEPPAEYWRYSFRRCTLDLFLYRDPVTGDTRVVYAEVRATWPTPVASFEGCRDLEAQLLLPPGAGMKRTQIH